MTAKRDARGKRSTAQRRAAGQMKRPVVRWRTDDGRKLLVLENAFCRVTVWPEMGGAISGYVDLESGIDIIWRNPYGQPPRVRLVDQPVGNGSDLYDVMDGSWYVSLPNGFFSGDYFGAPLGTHGELRSLPWTVSSISKSAARVSVTLVGTSVRTPLIYRRTLTLERNSACMTWEETLENRWSSPLPVAWLQHPTFGGPLLDGAVLIAPARRVQVYKAEEPAALQLESGYDGEWPLVPERGTGKMRDCSLVPPAGSGFDHSVQLSEFESGWGCVWNDRRRLGFAMAWDLATFPYAWSWNCSGGHRGYPLWGEGHIITLQPSTSPVGRFADLLRDRKLIEIPAHGKISTTMITGFVHGPHGPQGPEATP